METPRVRTISPRAPLHLLQLSGNKYIRDISKMAKIVRPWLVPKSQKESFHLGPAFQSLEYGWRGERGSLFKIKMMPPEESSSSSSSSSSSYLIHPLIADAMIQAAILWNTRDKEVKKKLHVPVHIAEFVWLDSSSSSSELYCYTTTTPEGQVNSLLVDSKEEGGHPLALMRGVTCVETTVKLVEGLVHQQQQQSAMGSSTFWEEIYRSCPGPLQNRRHVPTELDHLTKAFTDEISGEISKLQEVPGVEHQFHVCTTSIAIHYFLNALFKLGWIPVRGQVFTAESLVSSLKILGNFKPFVVFFLRVLADQNMLTMEERGDGGGCAGEGLHFHFSQEPPSPNQVASFLNAPKCTPETLTRAEYQLVSEVGKVLNQIFLGSVKPLPILFPEDPAKPNAGKFYESVFLWMRDFINLINLQVVIPILTTSQPDGGGGSSPGSSSKPVMIRVLEVGEGTGAMTRRLLDNFERKEVAVEYTFTDISAAFFLEAEKEFGKNVGKQQLIFFKKYNMDEDPLEQGFTPHYFDLVFAGEVLHIAKDVKRTLRWLRRLMRAGGILEIEETLTPDPTITFAFGLLEGYWQFEDVGFRRWHATLTPPMWEEALREAGFSEFKLTRGYMGVHGLILCTAARQSEAMVVDVMREVEGEEEPRHSWIVFGEGTSLTTALKDKLSRLTRAVTVFGVPPGLESMSESEFKGMLAEVLGKASPPGIKLEGILYLWGLNEESSSQQFISLPLVSLCQTLHTMGTTLTPSVYVVTRGVHSANGSQVLDPNAATLLGIVKSMNNENTSLLISGSFQLVLPASKLISDLEFTFLDNFHLEEGTIEIEVKATALNFRDVMVVLKPTAEFDGYNAMGLDVAGVVTRRAPSGAENIQIGDRVICMQIDEQGVMPSHLKIKAALAIPIPPNMTFAEGATLPAVFSTAYYCLIKLADMKAGETLLLHTASGGVGLCAIQFAKYIGAEVIATAGSPRKRTFLRNLGIQHVFNSRNTEYGQQILEVTGGRGVDIVLNSLTGPGFKEESLRALRRNGRFVEMSRLNVWSAEEVRELRPDVKYSITDITVLDDDDYKHFCDELRRQMAEGGCMEPIPYERFDALNIRGALNYLQKAKHVGKIVCMMPELKQSKQKKYYERTPMFSEDSTYLVTGGLGGIGFEVVKWILRSGGKHVVIASRNPPKPEMAERIEALNRGGGGHVVHFPVDVGSFTQCEQLFENIKSAGFPRLRGVMHAAGVLADAFIENQTWDNFRHTYNPKVTGTWNLHELTKSLLLEHFVLFSSVSAVLGSAGQTNHSASNCFEDSFTHYRKSMGLPATTINWGNWGEVGIATEIDFPGVTPISTAQGIAALEVCLRTPSRTQTVVANFDSFSMLTKLFPRMKSYLDDKRLLGEVAKATIINSDEFWGEVDSAEGREGKVATFLKYIITVVRNILNSDPDEAIDENEEFSSIGVDSLMMLEMKNSLQNVLGSRMTISASQLKDCNTPALLANRLVDLLLREGGHQEDKEEEDYLPSLEELKLLVKEDCVLPEHIKLDTTTTTTLPLKSIDQVSTLLLTGATGSLGLYLLRELIQRPLISRIICLMRKSGKLSLKERLQLALAKAGLLEQVPLLDRVEVVQGDLSQPSFGMSDQDYNLLAENVEAVIHSGVMADHVQEYWKNPRSSSSVRSVNVLGTLRVLEFSVAKRLKHVLHASSLLILNTVSESGGRIPEGWQPNDAFDSITINAGYRISKFIAEQLVKGAVERGLPCTALRLPLITGDSAAGAGRIDFKSNHLYLQCLSILRLGCMAKEPIPLPHIPVDKCATLCVQLFFTPNSSRDVYNVHPKFVEVEQVLVAVAEEEFGIRLQLVSFAEFLQRVRAEGENSPLSPLQKLYGNEEYDARVEEHMDLCHNYVSSDASAYNIDKLERFIPNIDEALEPLNVCFRRDLTHLRDIGVFQKFGIKY